MNFTHRMLALCCSIVALSTGCTQDDEPSDKGPSFSRSVSTAKGLAEAEWGLASPEKRAELCRVYRQQGEGGLRILPKTGLFSANDQAVEEWIKIVVRECGSG
ncbi:hypothetical protein [Streptomyces sp. 5-10]|uniref:hypothetical protein n=1 Tax=Streptomyces sp. 5-10 TaxID=878925 RepID=UPI00168A4C5B|nr:hypothetical protein [Streptomyces sp. 5-10]MBD3004556.1 hypothetical protein [Streptomyces sp. 5-10]